MSPITNNQAADMVLLGAGWQPSDSCRPQYKKPFPDLDGWFDLERWQFDLRKYLAKSSLEGYLSQDQPLASMEPCHSVNHRHNWSLVCALIRNSIAPHRNHLMMAHLSTPRELFEKIGKGIRPALQEQALLSKTYSWYVNKYETCAHYLGELLRVQAILPHTVAMVTPSFREQLLDAVTRYGQASATHAESLADSSILLMAENSVLVHHSKVIEVLFEWAMTKMQRIRKLNTDVV